MAGFYAVHHGPEGLTAIARRVLKLREVLRRGLAAIGLDARPGAGFDTVLIDTPHSGELADRAEAAGFNLRRASAGVGISLDELSSPAELDALFAALAAPGAACPSASGLLAELEQQLEAAGTPEQLLWQAASGGGGIPLRQGAWLRQEAFHRYRSETELLRYIQRLVTQPGALAQGDSPSP